ncbi:helix-turn-helix transcriptional regulator [Microbulbifer salipaludis]|uniref:Helix-turn-helix transcriptional regulator n=1 Tax=Microbulbifer salipaludis TaxID=187980 RepID=A0ABS3E2L9_9GAMM|nr:XRE family transcriptional regulator [Microbulbifer salipaludis]MBN8429536.1 helix-turn-helix transcriptional regulator [Microbulbifer salipaludis]
MPHRKAKPSKEEESVGKTLRRLRKERQMTLGELSDKSGISISSLSRIENTQLSLNVEKIHALAKVLAVPPEAFLQSQGTESARAPATHPARARMAINRARGRETTRELEVSLQYMFTDLEPRSMNCIYAEVDPIPVWESEFVRHPGEKVIIIQEGELMAFVQGQAPALLETGDVLYMDGNVWHSVVAANGRIARLMAVLNTGDAAARGDFESRFFTADEWNALNQ